ncbi:MAG: Bug family tripartite tricarboxylate transporter substrate binding protein [Rhodospirillaceae bacterium]
MAVALPLSAQTYPTKAVRIIVPYAAGGPYDEIARITGQRLSELWGQSVIADPRGGAGGSLGTDLAAKAPPDGYTLLLANAGPITINPSLQKKLPYDPQKDLVPLSYMLASVMVLVVHPSLPVKSVKELVAFAKSRPGRLNYASAGIGNLQHLGMELLQSLAHIRMNHVPYKGAAPAFVDLMGGQVELMFANITGAMGHVRSGRVRAIAVSSAKRAAVLPDVPGIGEIYPGFDISAWTGMFAPAGTPRDIVTKLQTDITRVLQRSDVRDRFAAQGAEVIAGTPEQLADLIRRETALYAHVIKQAGVTAE